MPLTITHSFVNPKADGPDATIVRPSDWNASHTVTGSQDYTQIAQWNWTTNVPAVQFTSIPQTYNELLLRGENLEIDVGGTAGFSVSFETADNNSFTGSYTSSGIMFANITPGNKSVFAAQLLTYRYGVGYTTGALTAFNGATRVDTWPIGGMFGVGSPTGGVVALRLLAFNSVPAASVFTSGTITLLGR